MKVSSAATGIVFFQPTRQTGICRDANLEFQLACCQEITRLLGLHHLSLVDYEADDIIGTLHKKFPHPVIIVTRDKDLGQLVGPEDQIWDYASDEYLGPAQIMAKFGVKPNQIADYLALAGDSVDNIPGAPGIGAKTAAALLNQFETIDGIYDSLDEVVGMKLRGAKKVHQILSQHREEIELYRRITQIECDIPIEVTLDDLRISPHAKDDILSFCDEDGIW